MLRIFQEPEKVFEQSLLSLLYLSFVPIVAPILHYVVRAVSTLNISKKNIGHSSINPIVYFSGYRPGLNLLLSRDGSKIEYCQDKDFEGRITLKFYIQ